MGITTRRGVRLLAAAALLTGALTASAGSSASASTARNPGRPPCR